MRRTIWTLAVLGAALLLAWSLLRPSGTGALASAVPTREAPPVASPAAALETLGQERGDAPAAREELRPSPAAETTEPLQPASDSEPSSELRRTLLLTFDSFDPREDSPYGAPTPASPLWLRASSAALDPTGAKARLRTYRSRWERGHGAGAHLQASVEVILHRPGRVDLATIEPIWNRALEIDHSSPEPIPVHIEAPVTRYLVLRGNQGRLGPDDVNVSIRQADRAGAGINRKAPRYEDQRRAWAVPSCVDALEVKCSLRRADLLSVDWTRVEWPGASRTATVDLSSVAVLRLTAVDDEGHPESLLRESVDASGPAGPVLLERERRRHEFWFGVPEFGVYRVTVTGRDGRAVTEQWFDVDGPGEHAFDLVVDG